MTVVLLGGIKSLEPHYKNKAKKRGVTLRVFNRAGLRSKRAMPNADGLVLFTGEVSHQEALRAIHLSHKQGIPLVRSHTSGINSLEKALHAHSQLMDKQLAKKEE